jgi:nitrogen regulatory protein P-II 1
MKKIEAIIHPLKVEEVKDALTEIGVSEITITEVRGSGRHKGQTEIFRGNEYTVDFLPEVKVEAVLQDTQVDAAARILYDAADGGKHSEGSLFVMPIERAYAKMSA